MGGKAKETQVIDNRTTVEPTPEEKELNRLRLAQQKEIYGPQTQSFQQGYELINRLLSGQQLPGYLSDVPRGVGEYTPLEPTAPIDVSSAVLSDEYARDLSREAIADLMPQFQSMGIADSGMAAEIAGRTAGDIRRAVAESNLERKLAVEQYNREAERAANQFNIANRFTTQAFNAGQLLNLLNLAAGAPAQIQQPVLAQGQMLSSSLAGLRSTSNRGSVMTTSPNPFITSFQTGLGTAFGSRLGGAGNFSALAPRGTTMSKFLTK